MFRGSNLYLFNIESVLQLMKLVKTEVELHTWDWVIICFLFLLIKNFQVNTVFSSANYPGVEQGSVIRIRFKPGLLFIIIIIFFFLFYIFYFFV
jgi:hypothetical protein